MRRALSHRGIIFCDILDLQEGIHEYQPTTPGSHAGLEQDALHRRSPVSLAALERRSSPRPGNTLGRHAAGDLRPRNAHWRTGPASLPGWRTGWVQAVGTRAGT